MPKVPVTQAGQPCRHCQTPVVEKLRSRQPNKEDREYWFGRWLKCPNKACRAIYLDYASKQFYASADVAPSVNPAPTPSPRPRRPKKAKKPKPPKIPRADRIALRALRKAQRKAERCGHPIPQKLIRKRVDYEEYINSGAWKMFRLAIIAQRGCVCERCGTAGPVDAHHLTYKRLGYELPEDIRLLCRACHQLMHPEKIIGSGLKSALPPRGIDPA